ncbi:MerR family transcriptional regulator [Furfurilactobacillus curtus]
MKEITEALGLSADTIRYYERIGVLPSIPRNHAGNRVFDQTTVDWLIFIQNLKTAGLSLSGIIQYVTLAQKGDGTIQERKQILLEQRQQTEARIMRLQQTLQAINQKIEHYDQVITPVEAKNK